MLEVEYPITAVTSLFESRTIAAGITKQVPGGAAIELLPIPSEASLLTMAVHLRCDGTANLFSAWMFTKLAAAGVRQIRINRRAVEVTAEAIKQVIEETVQSKNGTDGPVKDLAGTCG